MSTEQKSPGYGVISHYLGDKGRTYFAWQGEDGVTQALYNKHLWQPYISATDDLLDFGCGGGFLLKVLEAKRKAGVEVNPHARENARQLQIETYGSIEEISGTFDKVISSHALEHVPHPRQAVLELKEKLRNQHSRLLLLLPLDDWRATMNRRYRPNDVHMHLHTWTPQLLGNLLSSCGLRIDEVRVINHAWPPKRQLLWRLSPYLFHAAALGWSIYNKQRQLFAIAKLK
ncbi:MAG TPA: class I SAM-dependent methyltransferase [Nitrospiraceae bacterium]|nr:class I SAM-dependent methyltransferase [Nitrospiraceae bacterium]